MPASTTSRQSCSVLKQVSTRYICWPQPPSVNPALRKGSLSVPSKPVERFDQVNDVVPAGSMVNDCFEIIRDLAVYRSFAGEPPPQMRATFCLNLTFVMESSPATCQARETRQVPLVVRQMQHRGQPHIRRFPTHLSEGLPDGRVVFAGRMEAALSRAAQSSVFALRNSWNSKRPPRQIVIYHELLGFCRPAGRMNARTADLAWARFQ